MKASSSGEGIAAPAESTANFATFDGPGELCFGWLKAFEVLLCKDQRGQRRGGLFGLCFGCGAWSGCLDLVRGATQATRKQAHFESECDHVFDDARGQGFGKAGKAIAIAIAFEFEGFAEACKCCFGQLSCMGFDGFEQRVPALFFGLWESLSCLVTRGFALVQKGFVLAFDLLFDGERTGLFGGGPFGCWPFGGMGFGGGASC